MSYAGLLRPYVTGNYTFKCDYRGYRCDFAIGYKKVLLPDVFAAYPPFWFVICFVYHSCAQITSSTQIVFLEGHKNYRFKMDYHASSGDGYSYLQWKQPNTTVWESVTDEHFLREEVCENGCSGHGCCIGYNHCQCEPGFSGPTCAVDTSNSCSPTVAASTPVIPAPGLRGEVGSQTPTVGKWIMC